MNEKFIELKEKMYCILDEQNKAGAVLSDTNMELLIALCADPTLDEFITDQKDEEFKEKVIRIISKALTENTSNLRELVRAIR